MLSPPHRSDDASHAAIDRLTPKERECLDRWLSHATAKQIALELGVTHHAVEKRLKSARAKLGVTSTLEAARLLAAAQGYGQTASQLPEVASAGWQAQDDEAAASLPHKDRRRGRIIATGAFVMSLVLLAAIVLSAQSQTSTATPERKVVVVDRKNSSSSADLASAFGSAFAALDKNRDGFIAGQELTNAHFRVMRSDIAPNERESSSAATTLADYDVNADQRVSEAEFRAGMAKLTEPRS